MLQASSADRPVPGVAVTLETSSGPVRGFRDARGMRFLGIPYAAAPVGADRLRPPRARPPWTTVQAADNPGPWPPQNSTRHSLTLGEATRQDEDCLTVNVWTPGLDGPPRAVLVWLHGGGFVEGGGASRRYNGGPLAAARDIVVVTGNYRIGLLGFAAHESLRDPGTGAVGNWGLLDQMLMLRWVHANVSAFGGDPSRVALVGHSAGAMSVCDLMAMRQARGLFRRAIAQSGGPSAVPLADAARTVEWVVKRLGLDDPVQLRTVPVEDLLRAQRDLAMAGRGFATRPVIDGVTLERHPLDVDVDLEPLPLMIGTTRDEVRYFYAGTPILDELTDRALVGRIGHAVGVERGREIIAAYRRARAARGQGTSPGELLVAIESDRTLRVPATRFAERIAGVQPSTYMYRFDVEVGNGRGAAHGVDLPFVFGDPATDRWDQDAAALRDRVQRSWSRWTGGSDPAGEQASGWPRYDTARRATRIFTSMHPDGGEVVDAPDEPERAVWHDGEVQV